MNIELDDEGWKEIEDFVGSLQNKMNDENLKKVLRKVGKAAKKKVQQYAPERSQDPSYSDFGKGRYKHIKEDINYVVKKTELGDMYVTISGGKTTGYKWQWVNDGHIAQNGRYVPGTHFIDKAEAAMGDDINKAVNDFMEDLLKDGRID